MQNHQQSFVSVSRFCAYACVIVGIFALSNLNAAPNKQSTNKQSAFFGKREAKSSKASRITDEEIGMLILPKDFKNSQINPNELMQAQDERLKDKSLDIKIAFYRSLLEINGVQVKPIYKQSEYIEEHFASKTLEEKKAIAHKYMRSGKKSGFFVGLSGASAGITQTYADGKYNAQNGVYTTITDPDNTNQTIEVVETTGALDSSVDSPLVVQSVFVAFGGSGGYQNFFNLYFGSRIYGDVLIGGGNLSMESSTNAKSVGTFFYMLGGLNADLLAELPLSIFGVKQRFWREVALGGYFGINIGVMLLSDKSNKELDSFIKNGVTRSANVLWNYQIQVDYGLNAGLSLSLGVLGKFEFGAKIPLDVIGLPSELRLGIESPASYGNKEILSKDIAFKRTPIFVLNYIKVF